MSITCSVVCECRDKECTVHAGKSQCVGYQTTILYHVDMLDHTGTAFCDLCTNDALDSGLFSFQRRIY